MIYKYMLNTCGSQIVDMPKGSVVLSVQNQREELVLWADVPFGPTERRKFVAIPTGMPSPFGTYLGTVQFDGGNYVVHVYEVEL